MIFDKLTAVTISLFTKIFDKIRSKGKKNIWKKSILEHMSDPLWPLMTSEVKHHFWQIDLSYNAIIHRKFWIKQIFNEWKPHQLKKIENLPYKYHSQTWQRFLFLSQSVFMCIHFHIPYYHQLSTRILRGFHPQSE